MAARYRVELTSKAKRQLSALPKNVQKRIDVRLLALADNPRPPGVKKLHAQENRYRIRVGDYRIIYAIEETLCSWCWCWRSRTGARRIAEIARPSLSDGIESFRSHDPDP